MVTEPPCVLNEWLAQSSFGCPPLEPHLLAPSLQCPLPRMLSPICAVEQRLKEGILSTGHTADIKW